MYSKEDLFSIKSQLNIIDDNTGKQSVVDPSAVATDEASSWQVQSKPRRLGPQHLLSRQDLDEQMIKAPPVEKKKGLKTYCKTWLLVI